MRKAATPSLERVEAALADVAELLLTDARYLPIFERLSEEREVMLRQEDAMSRARAIVAARAGKPRATYAKCAGTENAMPRTISNRSSSVMASP